MKAVPASAERSPAASPTLWKTHQPASAQTTAASAATKSGDWAWGGDHSGSGSGSGAGAPKKLSASDANDQEVEKERAYLHEAVKEAAPVAGHASSPTATAKKARAHAKWAVPEAIAAHSVDRSITERRR